MSHLASVDLSGIALVIGAISAAVGPIVTAILQWQARRTHDKDKGEAITARAEQTAKIDEVHGIVSQVAPAIAKIEESPLIKNGTTEPPKE